MPIFMYIDGSWTEVSTPKVHVNDSWVDLTEVMVSMSGTWISVWDANTISGNYYIVQPSDTAARINEAVTQLQEHAIIIFGAGEWMITEPIIINRSNVTIQGVKNLSTLIRQFSSDPHVGMIQITGTSTNKLSNITIDGLIINSNSASGYTGSAIEGNYIGVPSQLVTSRDASLAGIDSTIKKGLTLRACTVNNSSSANIILRYIAYSDVINNFCIISQQSGIVLENVTFSNINNNSIYNNLFEGIYVENSTHLNLCNNHIVNHTRGSGIWVHNSERILLNENYTGFNGHNQTNGSVGGIKLTSSNENTIVSNISVENNEVGIWIESSNHNVISSNICGSNSVDGISINSSSYNSIISNIVTGNSDLGVYITDSSSNNIVLSNNSNDSIYTSSTSSGNKIVNNR